MVMDIKEVDFDSEVIEASHKQPVLVDFWAPWCGPCLMVAPILDEVSKELEGKAKIVKVNVDNNPSISAEYGIRSIPTMIVFKSGKVFATEVGVKPKESIIKLLS
jgi:thioredoxin 1